MIAPGLWGTIEKELLIAPEGVSSGIRPSWSLTQRFPSGPAVIPFGKPPTSNSVIVPLTLIRPTLPTFGSTNHSFPSGPAVISVGWAGA